jgi:hypothetical protein
VDKGLKDIFMLKYSLKEIYEKVSCTIRALIDKLTYEPHQIIISKEELLKSYEDEKNYHQMVSDSATNKDTLFKEVFYEDLCSDDRDKILSGILKYLGLSYEVLSSSRSKIDHHPLNERIKNFEELKSELQGTELAKYI